MVNEALSAARPIRELVLSYADPRARGALAALFALDERFAAILRATREPMVGQMRLTWWHGALCALDETAPPAEPGLRALAGEVLPRGVTGTRLAAMVEGWEALLDPEPLDEARLAAHARGRGATLFEAAGVLLGAAPGDPLAVAGEGWALADLAGHLSDRAAAACARAMAAPRLNAAMRPRWSRPARALGAMAMDARHELADTPGAAMRLWRLARFRLTGR